MFSSVWVNAGVHKRLSRCHLCCWKLILMPQYICCFLDLGTVGQGMPDIHHVKDAPYSLFVSSFGVSHCEQQRQCRRSEGAAQSAAAADGQGKITNAGEAL